MNVAATATETFEASTTARHFVPLMALERGGMGSVELVMRKQGAFKRLYARKRLHEVYQEDEDLRAMFLDEARIAGLLRHPNVVSVLDVGEDPNGPYLIMDYVDGESVYQILTAAKGAQLPVGVCIEIARQVAEGLHAAHELRNEDGKPLLLVHRDVSPQNILVGYDGIARVTDFGIARALGRTARTSTGVLKGKLGYMSPEQLRFHQPDRRSDLFALGIVVFELLTSRRLYSEKVGTESARRILEEPPPDVGEYREDVPDELDMLLFELLAKDPDNRPSDAGAVARRLADISRAHELDADVASFMGELFAQERADKHARIAAAIEAAERAPIEPVTTSGARSSRTIRPRGVALVVLAAVVLVGLGVALGQVLGPSADSERNIVTVQVEPSAGPPADENPAPAPTSIETATATEGATEPSDTPSDETATQAEEPTPREDRSPRRRRRPRAQTAMQQPEEPAADGVELPIWGWMR